MVVLTMGELILVPTSSKYVADLAPADMRGRYMSIYWLSWGMARTLAPLIGGLLNDRFGGQAIWLGGLDFGRDQHGWPFPTGSARHQRGSSATSVVPVAQPANAQRPAGCALPTVSSNASSRCFTSGHSVARML